MSFTGDSSYREIPFSPETPYRDFYTYIDLKEIAKKCKYNTHEVVRCRTVGILQSLHGRFYLTDFNSRGTGSEPLVQVSVVYLQTPPISTVIPYPVQIFGTIQWKNRPVLFAKIVQALKVGTALRLKNALIGITSIHLATNIPNENHDDTCSSWKFQD